MEGLIIIAGFGFAFGVTIMALYYGAKS